MIALFDIDRKKERKKERRNKFILLTREGKEDAGGLILFDAIYLFLEHPAKDDNLMELTIVYN